MLSRILIVLLMATPGLAAEPMHAVTPEDYFSLATVTEVAMSPDGKFVAYAEARWDKADDLRKGDLWVVAADGKSKPARVTFDRANDRILKWSADSKTIYFLGNRKREAEKKAPYDGKTQVWCIAATGGEPRAITKEAGGVDSFDLAAKAEVLFYSINAMHHDDDSFAKLRNQYKLDYGYGVRKVSEIRRINLDDWRTDTVYDEKRYVREFAVTQDGKRIAMVTAFDDTVVKSEGESRVDVWDEGKIVTPPTDAYRAKAASPYAWLISLAWDDEAGKLAFFSIFDGYPAEMIICQKRESKWISEKYNRGKTTQFRGYGSKIKSNYSGFSFLTDSAGQCLYEHDSAEPMSTPLLPKEWLKTSGTTVYAFDGAAVVAGFSNAFADIHIIGAENGAKKLTDVNPQARSWKLPSVKHITWKAPDGRDVGGALELPPGYDGKTKLPLVIAIHGGPTTSAKSALEFDPHNGRLYFCAAGYAVLCPNYRGSTGYGDKFVTDLIGHENDIEVKDIIAGVEHLVKEGIADPERVGVMGWSNGGYLTNCLITRKDLPFKLKAASSGAGIVDTVAEWGFNDEPAYPRVFKKGLPWETPDIYRATSPTYALGNVKTPTLIHVGGSDVRCPPGHSRMLYRALKEYLNVPTELCEYPGEPHGLTKMSHRNAKMEWDLAWFEKYLK